MDKKTFEKLKHTIETDPGYDFLKTNPHLGKNIIMLGLGGSYAYGTDKDGSDIDLRGVALNSVSEILTFKDFENVVVNDDIDAVIYSANKVITLLANSNPNTLELVGLSDDQIFYKNEVWDMLVKNQDIFLSKKVISTFGGYANAQLRKLTNKVAEHVSQTEKEKHILNSINFAAVDFKSRYAKINSGELKLYVDKSEKENLDSEIFADINLTKYPLRDLVSLVHDYNSVVKDYEKLGKRNKNAIEHNKLGKHMMHLIRLYYMSFDILEKGIVKTYRDENRDELMEIREGKYLNEDFTVKPEFFTFVDSLEARLDRLAKTTKLPDEPDFEKIEKLREDINREIVYPTCW